MLFRSDASREALLKQNLAKLEICGYLELVDYEVQRPRVSQHLLNNVRRGRLLVSDVRCRPRPVRSRGNTVLLVYLFQSRVGFLPLLTVNLKGGGFSLSDASGGGPPSPSSTIATLPRPVDVLCPVTLRSLLSLLKRYRLGR